MAVWARAALAGALLACAALAASHPLDSPDPAGGLQLMLAEGITGMRQMSGSPELLQRRREGHLLNGARVLNASDRPGRVAPGHEAELVVLASDPTLSVANLHKLVAVVRAGRYYSRADLDALLAHVRDRYGAQAAALTPARAPDAPNAALRGSP